VTIETREEPDYGAFLVMSAKLAAFAVRGLWRLAHRERKPSPPT
jgi:hypothetical protein